MNSLLIAHLKYTLKDTFKVLNFFDSHFGSCYCKFQINNNCCFCSKDFIPPMKFILSSTPYSKFSFFEIYFNFQIYPAAIETQKRVTFKLLVNKIC